MAVRWAVYQSCLSALREISQRKLEALGDLGGGSKLNRDADCWAVQRADYKEIGLYRETAHKNEEQERNIKAALMFYGNCICMT